MGRPAARRRERRGQDEHRSEDHQEQSGAVEASRDAGQRFAGVQDDGLLAG